MLPIGRDIEERERPKALERMHANLKKGTESPAKETLPSGDDPPVSGSHPQVADVVARGLGIALVLSR